MSTTTSRTSGKKRGNYGSDTDRSKRLNANMIERRRMQNINCGFSSLKKLLPPSDRKQTKAAILQQASQHIVRLQRAIIQFKTENDSLRTALSKSTCPTSHTGMSSIASCTSAISQYTNKPRDCEDCGLKQQNARLEYDYEPSMVKHKLHEANDCNLSKHRTSNASGCSMVQHRMPNSSDCPMVRPHQAFDVYGQSLAREREFAVEYDNELSLFKNNMHIKDEDCSLAKNLSTAVKESEFESPQNKLHKADECSTMEFDHCLPRKLSTTVKESEYDTSITKNRLHQDNEGSIAEYKYSVSSPTIKHGQESPLTANRVDEATSSCLVEYDTSLARPRPNDALQQDQESHLPNNRVGKANNNSLVEYNPSLARIQSNASFTYDPAMPLHHVMRMPSIDCNWRRFEHVKKFKPASPKTSGFQPEGYHGLDSKLPTPPVSPEMVSQGGHLFKPNMLPTVTSSMLSLNSCQTARYQSPELFARFHCLQPPKKNIFNSTVQGSSSPEHARGVKRKSSSQTRCAFQDRSNLLVTREGREGKDEKEGREGKTNGSEYGLLCGKENYHGDLQSIIDAIHIIEHPTNQS